VVGGSIAGCAAAAEFSRAGHDVTVFERSVSDLVHRRQDLREYDRRGYLETPQY
jgi:2-polyprenyl-6-methoxyphenol hydroxylase-like FAD-dependent oxidoreductase